VTRLLDGRHHLERFAMEQAGEVDYDQGDAEQQPVASSTSVVSRY
jgi:hypothetical protein